MTDTDDAVRSGWQLEDDSAEAYERYLVPQMFAPWADDLVAAAGLAPGERVLDVGCGTGVVARRAADVVGEDGRVVGLDPNDGMLAVARTRPDASTVEWRRGEAADLPFTDGAFDAVVCQQALQFVPDPDAALAETYRVLADDGRLACSVWRPIDFHTTYRALADALERHVGDEAAAMMRSPFTTWDRETLRDFVHGAGFRDATVRLQIGSMRYPSVEEFVRREAASSPLAGPLGDLDPDRRAALLEDVTERVAAYTDDDGVVFPMESYVVTARR